MLLQTTKRSPCGNIVARVVADELWLGYSVFVYAHGKQVSAYHRATRIQAEQDAADACLQTVTQSTEPMQLVPL
jgi:hypothetical protein